MIKYFKPARGREYMRGYFSYIKESVINLYNAEKNNPNQEIKIFFDLFNIPGYGGDNLYEICFVQDHVDFIKNRNEYSNIENESWRIKSEDYDLNLFNMEIRKECETIIKKYFKMTEEMNEIISSRHSQIDFSKTIGLHRRATDMEKCHDIKTHNLQNIFSTIEKEEFENIFLMSDNLEDLRKIKKRYGNKIITYDEFTSSENIQNPFFKNNISDNFQIRQHIKEIVFGTITLGKTKKLICTLSNLTGFSILSNSKLNYKILN